MFNNDESNSEFYYDIAQICLNGHLITEYAQTQSADTQAFCSKCGQPTITACPSCNTPIKGYHHTNVTYFDLSFQIPSFCEHCGHPYPWFQSRLEAAKELADTLDKLSSTEKENLKKDLADIIQDAPRAHAASLRFRTAMIKAGKEAASMFRDILVSLVAEATLKKLGL